MKEDIKINVDQGVKELVLRQGKAEELVPFREKVIVVGNLDTPFNYLKNPPAWFTAVDVKVKEEGENYEGDSPLNYSEVYVDRDNMSIELVVDAGAVWESKYKGILKEDEGFKLFAINTGKSYTTFELAELFKMNRSHFETKDIAMKLVNELVNFQAKVNKQLQDSDDSRGNKTFLMQQAVESNIPKAFNLNIPIFKGFEKHLIEVEVSISARDFSCTLISPEANDIINETKNGLIDEQLELIRDKFSSLKIFEI